MKLDEDLIEKLWEETRDFEYIDRLRIKNFRPKLKNITAGEVIINIEEFPNFVFEEIIRIFSRLTQYPDNSLIPIYDLLSRDHPFIIRQSTTAFGNPATINFRVDIQQVLVEILLEWISYVLRKVQNEIELPSQYLPTIKAFEKRSNTIDMILKLEKSFQDFKSSKI